MFAFSWRLRNTKSLSCFFSQVSIITFALELTLTIMKLKLFRILFPGEQVSWEVSLLQFLNVNSMWCWVINEFSRCSDWHFDIFGVWKHVRLLSRKGGEVCEVVETIGDRIHRKFIFYTISSKKWQKKLTTWIFIWSISTILLSITEETTFDTVSITTSQETVLTQRFISDQKWLHLSLLVLQFAVFHSAFPITGLLFDIKIQTSWTTNRLKTLKRSWQKWSEGETFTKQHFMIWISSEIAREKTLQGAYRLIKRFAFSQNDSRLNAFKLNQFSVPHQGNN